MAKKRFFGGGQTEYSCSRKNHETLRRAARRASAQTDCEIEIRCLGRKLDINFYCSTHKIFDKAGNIFFGLLDRARASGELAGKKSRR